LDGKKWEENVDNSAIFNIQALRTMAFLYRVHATPVDLDGLMLLEPDTKKDDPKFIDLIEAAAGTIRWLLRNGLISGEQSESEILYRLMKAQLTSRAWKILSAPDKDAGGNPLGQYAVASLSTAGEIAAATLVMKRLLGG
jgi:hypothetical protein